jgi:hypothetical protein
MTWATGQRPCPIDTSLATHGDEDDQEPKGVLFVWVDEKQVPGKHIHALAVADLGHVPASGSAMHNGDTSRAPGESCQHAAQFGHTGTIAAEEDYGKA